MGRGRAKAKQTKVARQLKYGVPQTDLERLEAELRGTSGDENPAGEQEPEEDEDYPYTTFEEVSEEDDE